MNCGIFLTMKSKEILANKKCNIFDMDGTLVNLEELNQSSYASAIEKYFNMGLEPEDYQKYFSGTKTLRAFSDYLKSKSILKYDIHELVKAFRERKKYNLMNKFKESVSLIPGTTEYLTYLKGKKKVLAIATSTIRKFTMIILRNLDITKYFDLIITADDVIKGKPDPEIYNLAINKLGEDKSQAVVYEDSRNGIASAKAADILCIGIHTRGLNDSSVKEADYIIDNYFELL